MRKNKFRFYLDVSRYDTFLVRMTRLLSLRDIKRRHSQVRWKVAALQVQVPDACRPFHASPLGPVPPTSVNSNLGLKRSFPPPPETGEKVQVESEPTK